MTPEIKLYQSKNFKIKSRPNEVRIGEEVRTLSDQAIPKFGDELKSFYKTGGRYVLLGVPEDVGPKANYGRGGADGTWEVFLPRFLNLQSNRFLNGHNILTLGSINLDSILEKGREKDTKKLREICSEIDEAVYPVVKSIVAAGLKPIVIGGGHNNAYPIIRATSEALGKKGIACINCDAHLDFRLLEGRHSGNPFSYAFEEGYLFAYSAVGVHENYNSEEMLARIDEINKNGEKIRYDSFERYLREELTFKESVKNQLKFLSEFNLPLGVEVDLESIASMSVSHATPSGLSLNDVRYYVNAVAKNSDTRYLHIAEGAPKHSHDGKNMVGKALAYLVADYITATEL